MKLTKEQILEKALTLNGDDKNYVISVEDDKIITRAKQPVGNLFPDSSVTDKICDFEYVVKVSDNGKYSELDKSVTQTTSVKSSKLGFSKSMHWGKQISFSHDSSKKANGENPVFSSEAVKAPVRTMLKEAGYKKKMGFTAKAAISGAVIAAIAIMLVLFLVVIPMLNKKPVTVEKFESVAKENGYVIAIDKDFEALDEVESVRIAINEEKGYQIDFYVLKDSSIAKNLYNNNKAAFIDIKSEYSNSSSSSADSPKYQKYTVTTSGHFLYIARINNTVIYVNESPEHKNEINKFIKKLGY